MTVVVDDDDDDDVDDDGGVEQRLKDKRCELINLYKMLKQKFKEMKTKW